MAYAILDEMDDLDGQYCNGNCIGCSVSSLTKHFYCEENLRNLHLIFLVLFMTVAVYVTWHDNRMLLCATCVMPALIVALKTTFH